jgi:hypothetical protein
VGTSWQIQYTGTLDTTVAAEVYDVDLFDTPASTVAALKVSGRRVMCYLNAGAWENWRPDKDQFPAAVIGRAYAGWPGEKWLDIGAWELLAPIMRARLDLCKAKGFDGVDPDNLDGYTQNTGFTITATQQLSYNRWLAREAHARGLAIGLKNDPDQIPQLVDVFDYAVTEQCLKDGWCDKLKPFTDAAKPIFAIEYVEDGQSAAKACAAAQRYGLSLVVKRLNLDAYREACN